MGLATGQIKTIAVPSEDATVVIRKLSHKKLREAENERRKQGVAFMKEIGAELMKALREGDAAQIKKIEEA